MGEKGRKLEKRLGKKKGESTCHAAHFKNCLNGVDRWKKHGNLKKLGGLILDVCRRGEQEWVDRKKIGKNKKTVQELGPKKGGKRVEGRKKKITPKASRKNGGVRA